MATRKKTSTRIGAPVAVAVPAPLFASAADLGRAVSALDRSARKAMKPCRDFFLTVTAATFARIVLRKPKTDKDGNPAGLAEWEEIDIKSDDVKACRKEVCSGILTDLIDSGDYDTPALKAADAVAVKNATKEARKGLPAEHVKACDAVVKRITNTVDATWSRNFAAWLSDANASARQEATGERRPPADSFKVLIGTGSKGKLRARMLAAAKRDRDAGLPVPTEEEIIKTLDVLLSRCK